MSLMKKKNIGFHKKIHTRMATIVLLAEAELAVFIYQKNKKKKSESIQQRHGLTRIIGKSVY